MLVSPPGGSEATYRWERRGAEVLVTLPVPEDVQSKVAQTADREICVSSIDKDFELHKIGHRS